MQSYSQDPVDHARTTRQPAGESFGDGLNSPGMAIVWIAGMALIIGFYSMAVGFIGIALSSFGVAFVLGSVGLGGFAVAHRRLREIEHDQQADPGEPCEPPAV